MPFAYRGQASRHPIDTESPAEVEAQYPSRSECLWCKKRHPVHQDGVHVGRIAEHEVVVTQISDDQRYSCTVTGSCPGSYAKVSKWKRIP